MEENSQIAKPDKQDREVTQFDFTICPNCGDIEVGKYCPSCGQSNKDFNRPIKEIVGELAGSINLDARIAKTLKPFFLKPGFLTKEYFAGRRQRYVPPMRLYMFFSIVFFFLAQYTSNSEIKDNILTIDDNTKETEKPALVANGPSLKENLEEIAANTNDSIKNKGLTLSLENLSDETIDEGISETMKDTSISDMQRKMIVGGLKATKNKDLFYSRFLKNLSYVLFLLMPFFALILAMILWRSKLLYVKHLIFSINFHSFVFGISSVIMLLGMIIPKSFPDFENYLFFTIPIYLMLGIRNFYNRKLSRSFFKMIGAISLYAIVISVVIVVILLITAKEFYNM